MRKAAADWSAAAELHPPAGAVGDLMRHRDHNGCRDACTPLSGATCAGSDAPDGGTCGGSKWLGGLLEADRIAAALRASEQRFRDFAAASSDWFWECDTQLRFTWFSDSAGELCGIAPQRLIGRTRQEIGFGFCDAAAMDSHMAELLAHRPFRDFRYRTRTDSGELVWFSISGIPVFDPSGNFRGYRGTGCNVTSEVLADQRAEKAQQRLQDAIDSITHGFALFDADDRLVLCNDNYREALAGIADILEPGLRVEQLLTTALERGCIVVPEDQRATWVATQMQRRREGPAPRTFQTAAGRWIEVHEFLTRDGGRVVIRTDVTEAKRAEAALRRSQASLTKAQRIAHFGNWELCVNSSAMFWSDEIYGILGLARGKVAADHPGFLAAVHPADRPRVEQALAAALLDGIAYTIKHRVTRPDGSVHWVIQQGEVEFDAEAIPRAVVGTLQDVTDRRAAEQRLSESEERFRIAFETSADAISISRLRDGVYVDVNEAFARLFGYGKDDVIGRTSTELGIWPSLRAREEFVARLAAEQAIRDAVLQLRRMDGELRTMLVSASHCVLGDEPHLLASLRDITELQRNELELRKLWQAVEQSSVAVITTDAEGRIEYVNPCFTAITGYSRDEVVGRNPSILKSGLTPEHDYQRLWDTVTSGAAWQGEFCNRRKDGSLFWGVASISPVQADDGRITHFVGIQADITERKRAEQELRASEERFRSLVETSFLGICIERDGKPLFVNQTFAEIFGYDDIADVLALESLDPLGAFVEATAAAPGPQPRPTGRSVSPHELQGVRKDGSVVWLHAQSRTVPWNGGTAVQFTVLDITLRKRYEDRLQHQANFDPVTDLPNRTLAMDRLGSAIEAARRRATRVSLLFIDVDHFKKINDTLGHAAGDRFLRQLAQRLKASIRQMDTVARLGGDEFVVVLSDVRLRSDAEAIAAKIVEACAPPFLLDGQEAFVSLSIGIASFPDDGEDGETLLRHADAAMYVGKETGRSQVRLFTPELRQRSHNRIRMEVDLRHAIKRRELVLHYQPLIDIRTGQIIGAEALLRWFSAEHGELSPDQFVRLAEDTGMIVPIGEWALASGCRQMRRWIDAGHDHLSLSVNVSSRQFRDAPLLSAVRSALRENRLDPRSLELEITESLLIEDSPEIRSTIDRLVEDGVRLAIDDFGTGYSSLSYLNRFPLDTLKIDRSFTGGMLEDVGQSTLVDALIVLAHRLRLRVVAEGVESAEQLEFLRGRGCDLAQGFFFSPALPADEFLQLLDRQRQPAVATG